MRFTHYVAGAAAAVVVIALLFGVAAAVITAAGLAALGAYLHDQRWLRAGVTPSTRRDVSAAARRPSPTPAPPTMQHPGQTRPESPAQPPAIARDGRPGRIYYRPHDGSVDYLFDLVTLADGTWRAYIVRQPEYGSRSTGLSATHRLHDSRGYYVCWDHPVPSMDDMKTICALWAEATNGYIASGRSLDAVAARIQSEFAGRDLWQDA